MLLRCVLLSAVLIGTCFADQSARFAVHRIMKVVEVAVEREDVAPITFLLDNTFNYSMCGYEGNKHTFKGYLENQLKSLIDIKFRTDYDNADIEEQNGVETLKFTVETEAIYKDKSRVEGEAVVTAIRKQSAGMFYLSHIFQQCRVTAKRHHRLYRLFTNENLYDYRK